MIGIVLTIVALSFAEEETIKTESVSSVSNLPEDVLEYQQTGKELPIGQRMRHVTEPLLGLPYILDGIGEEQEPDMDPFVRYDGFDCLTFVEEALALSLASDIDEISTIRMDLRYGTVNHTYANRNHFMISQWIPNALDKGYLLDITHTLGETHVVSKEITRRNWERWRGRHRFMIPPTDFPVGTYRIGVLSLDSALQALPNIPEGSLVVVVRQNNPHNPVWITHLGFVVRDSENDVRIRHATKMAGGVVKEHYLKWYFEQLRLYRRPIEGILILMPQERVIPEVPK